MSEASDAPMVSMWEPDRDSLLQTNIGRTMSQLGFADYDQFYEWSITKPAEFWGFTINQLAICFSKSPDEILDLSTGLEQPTWLRGAKFNIVESCLQASDRTVAIVERSAAGVYRATTYGQLNDMSARVANGLSGLGMKCGDAVAVFLPMTTEAVAIYLGIVRAGCCVVSIADSFSAEQVAARLRIGNAKLAFTVGSTQRGPKSIPVYGRLVDAQGPPAIIIEPGDTKLREGDLDWETFVSETAPLRVDRPATPESAINVLFSSGTTGDPKAIVWDHTTAIKAAADGYYHQDIQPGDVAAWPTSLGWMMGPWLIFATLINRGTMALYGGSPTEAGFVEFVGETRVAMLGVVPSIVKAWRESGCLTDIDWSNLKLISSTGECSNPDDMAWLSNRAGGKPIIEYCGGTEIGGGYISSTLVQPNVASAFSSPTLGSQLLLLDEHGNEVDEGEVFIVPPAIGLSRRLLNGDHHQVYYAGTPQTTSAGKLRRHGDQMTRLPNGYFRALGRADDTMNLGGIKVGAAEIERVAAIVPGVSELAAVAVPSSGGGPSRLVLYVVPSHVETKDNETLRDVMQQAIKEHLNPLFKIHAVAIVDQLPRTASNKILRRRLREDWATRESGPA